MTAPGGIVDPQLTAFFASDPSRLSEQPAAPATDHHDRRREELALAIAAATLVAVKIVRDRLAARHETATTAGDAAREEWRRQAPNWLMAVLPAVHHLYQLGRVGEGLTPAETTAVASDYANAVGDYIGDTSADALAAGLQIQLNNRWDERVAWQRASAAYGLDKREMRQYLIKAITGSITSADQLISPAARTFIDKAILIRADLIGRSESWTALETGKALSWMYQQRLGRLPEGAMREWDTAEDESTCAICAPLDKSQASLQQPFEINGHKLWAPQAHPGCRCHVRLVLPEPAQITKSNKNHDSKGRFATQPGARKVRVKEATPVDPAVAEMLRQAETITPDNVEEVVEEVKEPQLPEDLSRLLPVNLANMLPTSLDRLLPTVATPGMLPQVVTPGMLPQAHSTMLPSVTSSVLPITADPRLTPAQARAAHRVAMHHVRRRIVVLPPAPKEPRVYGVYASVDAYNHLMNRGYGHDYRVGEDIDFSAAQANSHGSPFFAKEHIDWRALNEVHMFRKRAMKENDPERANINAHWHAAAPEAHAVFQQVVRRPMRALAPSDGLTDDELYEIAELAGMRGQGNDLDAPQIRTAIISNCSELHHDRDGDTSLAQAFGDYVTWRHPEWYGERGQNLAAMLDAARDFQQSWPFTRATSDQVFFFDTARRSDFKDGVVTPHGNYVVSQIDYKSSLEDLGRNPPPLHMGLQVLHLKPYFGGGTLGATNYRFDTIKLNQ